MKFINSNVNGYKGMKIPYTLYGKTDHSQDLLILLPGSGYTVNSPVFHYSSGIFFNQSIDILEVNYPYKNDFYNDFSSDELYAAVKFDSRKVIDTVLENNSYNNFHFIGKSLGTIALSSLLSRDVFQEAKVVWLTPLLNRNDVFEAMVKNKNKGLCFIGDNDRFYSEELFLKLNSNEHIKFKLLNGVNHSLDNDDDPIKSIDVLKTIIIDIDRFLTK